MKTLDKVIAELEDEELFADALFYLKEYKSDKEELDSTRLAYLDILTDYVALKQYWAEQQENPPLTWDELKSMEGKPVWVETSCHKYWGLFNGVWDKHGKPHAMFIRGYQHQEKLSQFLFIRGLWQAYRKERE